MPRPAIGIVTVIGMTVAATIVLNTARGPTGRTAATIMIPIGVTTPGGTTITGIIITAAETGGPRYCHSFSGAEPPDRGDRV
jgi:hypothetical protein